MLLYVYCMMSDDVSTWFILSETWRGRWCVSIHRLAGSACRCFAIWPFECVCLGLGKRPTDFFGTRRRKVEWVHMQMFSSDATACRSDWSITCRGQDCVRWPRKEVVWWLKWRIWVQMLKAAYVWSTCIYHKKHPFFGFSFPNIVDPCCIHFFITSQLQCGVCRLHAPLITALTSYTWNIIGMFVNRLFSSTENCPCMKLLHKRILSVKKIKKTVCFHGCFCLFLFDSCIFESGGRLPRK